MKTLVIGVGNDDRGDDAIGLIAARRIRELNLPNVQVIESNGEFTKLMESWKDAESVILIDAVQSGAALGTIHRVSANEEEFTSQLFSASTHAFGVAEAIALSKALGKLPPRFIVFGVEVYSFALGEPLSAKIVSSIEQLLQLVKGEVSQFSSSAN
jgi:hydrogenase maturation protease